MKLPRVRFTVRRLLVCIAVVGVMLAISRTIRPMSRESAIQIAAQHASEIYPGIDLDGYSISAPPRPDWFEEWGVIFNSKSGNSGFLILVVRGDLYNGPKLRVVVDNAWGQRP